MKLIYEVLIDFLMGESAEERAKPCDQAIEELGIEFPELHAESIPQLALITSLYPLSSTREQSLQAHFYFF